MTERGDIRMKRKNRCRGLLAIVFFFIFTSVSAFALKTDENIESSANNSYVFRTYLKSDSIKTQSRDGVVTLTGTVANESHKQVAQDVVAGITGVTAIINNLQVRE